MLTLFRDLPGLGTHTVEQHAQHEHAAHVLND